MPFLNKFVLVEGVDFADFKACKKQDEIDEKFAEQVETEEALARLCDPMLDLADERRTIIFSATVSMAQHTADYINARSRCLCSACNKLHWYPTLNIGDGRACRDCGAVLDGESVVKCGPTAHFMDGETPHVERQRILREYRSGDVQFLSVCGLCKEGFNDPPTSCVVVFRPVSKKAGSLAEQMKGRGSRPLAGIIEGLATAEERKQAIAESAKPNCLVVDLVGITGLADCASTVQIYAEGIPDAIVARAEEIAVAGGVPDPLECLAQAQREAEEEARRRREKMAAEIRRRKEAEQRAKLDPRARYETHEFGHNGRPIDNIPGMATEGQVKFLHFLGMDFNNFQPTKRQAGRMIDQFTTQGKTPDEVAYVNGIQNDEWKPSRATAKQIIALARHGIDATGFTPKQASHAFDRLKGRGDNDQAGMKSPIECLRQLIASAETHGTLDSAGKEICEARRMGKIDEQEFQSLVELGRQQRSTVF